MSLMDSAMTAVLTVFGRKSSVNDVKGGEALVTISGELSDKRLSTNVCVYAASAIASLAYMPAVAPELRACVLFPTSTANEVLRATSQSA
jgi:hypothetical protein